MWEGVAFYIRKFLTKMIFNYKQSINCNYATIILFIEVFYSFSSDFQVDFQTISLNFRGNHLFDDNIVVEKAKVFFFLTTPTFLLSFLYSSLPPSILFLPFFLFTKGLRHKDK